MCFYSVSADSGVSRYFNGPMNHVHSTLGYKLPAQFMTTGSRLSRNDKPRHEALPLEDEKPREPHIGVDPLDHRNAGPAER
jgi:hypothetical protein